MTTRGRFAMAAAIAAFAATACTGPTPSPTALTSPGGTTTPVGSPGAPASETPATSAPATPGSEATAEATAGASAPASDVPIGSVAPSVDSLTIGRTASCASDNGTGQVGSITISWTASGTTGVRVSIDPPSPDVAYGFGYGDYPVSGSAVVPFACNPPNHDTKGAYHLYVVTTIHASGYSFYRYAKVYDSTPLATPMPTATP